MPDFRKIIPSLINTFIVPILLSGAVADAEASGVFGDIMKRFPPSSMTTQSLNPPSRVGERATTPSTIIDPDASPAEVRKMSLKTSDLLTIGDRIYAGVRSDSPEAARSIAVIDPVTATVERTYPLEDEPGKLAVSRDGQFLYVALKGTEGKVLRLVLPGLIKDFTFPLKTEESSNLFSYAVGEMKVLPDRPESVIIAPAAIGYVGNSRFAIYDDGIKRPAETDYAWENIWITPDGQYYAYNESPIGYDNPYRLIISDNGVTEEMIATSGFGNAPHAEDSLYLLNGYMIDPKNKAVRKFGVWHEAMALLPDINGNRIYFIDGDFAYPRLSAYDLSTGEPAGHIWPEHDYYVGLKLQSMIRWGADGIAFRSYDSIYLVTSPIVVPPADPPVVPPVVPPPITPPIRTRADLAITESENANPAGVTYKVTNKGPHAATGVRAAIDIGEKSVLTATAEEGECTAGSPVVCTWATFPDSGSRMVTIVLKGEGKELTRTASVTANETDLISANNSVVTTYFNDHFPLNTGYSWTYYYTDSYTYFTQHVLPKTEYIEGAATRAVETKESGYREYYSSGKDGIFLHRQYQPRLRIPGAGTFNVALSYYPPLRLGGAEFTPGETYSSYGEIRSNKIRGYVARFGYSAVFTADKDRVTVDGKMYDAVKLTGFISIDGDRTYREIILAPKIGIVKMSSRSGNTTVTAQLSTTNTLVHNLVLQAIVAPKSLTLKNGKPKNGKVIVTLNNKSSHPETIGSLRFLEDLVSLSGTSLGACPNLSPRLLPPKTFPVVIQPGASYGVSWDVLFDCANDAAATTRKSPGHHDYSFSAHVYHGALEGIADYEPVNDVCPRQASGTDAGCGTKQPDGTRGSVMTDIIAR